MAEDFTTTGGEVSTFTAEKLEKAAAAMRRLSATSIEAVPATTVLLSGRRSHRRRARRIIGTPPPAIPPTPATEFRIGDRVSATSRGGDSVNGSAALGTVFGINHYDIGVEFDEQFSGGHSGNNNDHKHGHCWYLSPSGLTLVKKGRRRPRKAPVMPQFKAGDTVVVRRNCSGAVRDTLYTLEGNTTLRAANCSCTSNWVHSSTKGVKALIKERIRREGKDLERVPWGPNEIVVIESLHNRIIKKRKTVTLPDTCGWPRCYMLGKNKEDVIVDFVQFPYNKITGCREMSRLMPELMAKAATKLFKKDLQPCGILRIGRFYYAGRWGSDSGSALRELSKINMFIMSADLKDKNNPIVVQRYNGGSYKTMGYGIAPESKPRTRGILETILKKQEKQQQ